MPRWRWPVALLWAVLALGALGACKSSANDNPTIGGGSVGQISDVTMQAVSGGQSGTATLSESPSLVLAVTINLTTAPAADEPASIHAGACSNFTPSAKFSLSPVSGGRSTTSGLNTTLGELSSSPYVIVVSRSASDPTTVSCGPIPQTAPST